MTIGRSSIRALASDDYVALGSDQPRDCASNFVAIECPRAKPCFVIGADNKPFCAPLTNSRQNTAIDPTKFDSFCSETRYGRCIPEEKGLLESSCLPNLNGTASHVTYDEASAKELCASVSGCTWLSESNATGPLFTENCYAVPKAAIKPSTVDNSTVDPAVDEHALTAPNATTQATMTFDDDDTPLSIRLKFTVLVDYDAALGLLKLAKFKENVIADVATGLSVPASAITLEKIAKESVSKASASLTNPLSSTYIELLIKSSSLKVYMLNSTGAKPTEINSSKVCSAVARFPILATSLGLSSLALDGCPIIIIVDDPYAVADLNKPDTPAKRTLTEREYLMRGGDSFSRHYQTIDTQRVVQKFEPKGNGVFGRVVVRYPKPKYNYSIKVFASLWAPMDMTKNEIVSLQEGPSSLPYVGVCAELFIRICEMYQLNYEIFQTPWSTGAEKFRRGEFDTTISSHFRTKDRMFNTENGDYPMYTSTTFWQTGNTIMTLRQSNMSILDRVLVFFSRSTRDAGIVFGALLVLSAHLFWLFERVDDDGDDDDDDDDDPEAALRRAKMKEQAEYSKFKFDQGDGGGLSSFNPLSKTKEIASIAVFAADHQERLKENTVRSAYISGVWGDGIWWSYTTITTVGYGDMYPKTVMGRLWGIFWMIAPVFFLSTVIAMTVTSMSVQAMKPTQLGSLADIGDRSIGVCENSAMQTLMENQGFKDNLVLFKGQNDVARAILSGDLWGGCLDQDTAVYYTKKPEFKDLMIAFGFMPTAATLGFRYGFPEEIISTINEGIVRLQGTLFMDDLINRYARPAESGMVTNAKEEDEIA
jgi:hypothetical protein